MPDHDVHTFRGDSQQQRTSGKGRSVSSFQAREDHHPSDGVTFPSGHSSPYHVLISLFGWLPRRQGPSCCWKPGHKPFPGHTMRSDLGLSIWGPRHTLGQKRGSRAAEVWGPAGLAPTHGFSPKHSWGRLSCRDTCFIQSS